MKVEIINKKKEELSLNKKIWDERLHSDLITQAVTTYLANQRTSSANTKTRAEVSGGGNKPWRQKGTGRARHGSTRSPIWVGGGIAFGPTSKINWKKKLNKKMKRSAFCSVLSERYRDGSLGFIHIPDSKDYKKLRKQNLSYFSGKTNLFVTDVENHRLAFRNVGNITIKSALQLNIYDLLKYEKIFLIPKAVELLENRLS